MLYSRHVIAQVESRRVFVPMEGSCLECEEATLHTLQLFISLGFKIHCEKSVVIPTQVLGFLGFTFNSILMTVTLREKNAERILQLCQNQAGSSQCVRLLLSLGP